MKHVRIILIITLLATSVTFFTACVIRKSEPITQREFIPANARIANGEKMFMRFCHQCHPGGESGLAPAINPNPAPQFVKRFQVRHGLGVMPSFKKEVISKKDLHDISRYLRAWKRY